jgi:Rad3-related DNA helicase
MDIYPDVRRRILTHVSKDREVVFQDFEKNPGNHILITPAATTGVDWDFVGWQMIPKIPFPNLGDDIVRLRYEYCDEEGDEIGKEVFKQEAALAVVQASGRNIRTPISKGVTVITDSNFWSLFEFTSRASFPAWFREAVEWYHPNKGGKS